MVNFFSTDFDEIEKYFIDNIDAIELVDIIKIDKNNINKLDMLILNKYGYSNRDYVTRFLPLILSYNNLADITEITVGTIFKFPNINSLIENLEINETFITDIVSGVNSVGYNEPSLKNNTNNSKNNKTTALPKLSISLPSVDYNPESGIITY